MEKAIRSGLIILTFKETGWKIKSMAKGYINGIMDTTMMVNGKIMIYTAKVSSFGRMEEDTKDPLYIIKEKAKESTHGWMEESTMVNGKQGSNMV